jgi:biopolymer transport protein ExbD
MAEIDSGGGKKVSTKIDMTPMVDLAFLLITFFMLTTTFSKPQTMEVNVPDKTKDDKKMDLKESKTVILVLAEDNRIFYYQGTKNPVIQESSYAPNGIRKLLLDKTREIGDPFFIIKAKNTAKYKNVVDILDEMAITKAERYALVDITKEDIELVDKAKLQKF